MPITALIIDDDLQATDIVSLILKTKGIKVYSTTSGKDGIDFILEKNPDIVLVDLVMPELDGWEVCQRIRKISKVPIIILSVLNDPQIIASALDAGADDYLVKPVPGNIILAHINKLIRRAEAERTRQLMGTRPLAFPERLNDTHH